MNLKKLIFITIFIPLFSCGYIAVNQDYLENYQMTEVNVTGDSRVAFLLKNKFNSKKQNSSKSISISIETQKNKTIKEKNVKNEIAKYEITITAKVEYYLIDKNKKGQFLVSKKENYEVSEKHHRVSLDREKKIIKKLVNEIADDIRNNLQLGINDL